MFGTYIKKLFVYLKFRINWALFYLATQINVSNSDFSLSTEVFIFLTCYFLLHICSLGLIAVQIWKTLIFLIFSQIPFPGTEAVSSSNTGERECVWERSCWGSSETIPLIPGTRCSCVWQRTSVHLGANKCNIFGYIELIKMVFIN